MALKVDLIDWMGNDLTVVNAARVSFDKESGWEENVDPIGCGLERRWKSLPEKDKKLISYLAKHGHWTPFSHVQITMRYTVPIFVARQEAKHQVGFTRNEVSRRYVDDDPEFYKPEVWRSRPEEGIKQGSGDRAVDTMEMYGYTHNVSISYEALMAHAEVVYRGMVEAGVAPEQARMVLPQSMYTSYYITGSLAAFARFYKQRSENHAQKEIQELAEMVAERVSTVAPVSWEALTQ